MGWVGSGHTKWTHGQEIKVCHWQRVRLFRQTTAVDSSTTVGSYWRHQPFLVLVKFIFSHSVNILVFKHVHQIVLTYYITAVIRLWGVKLIWLKTRAGARFKALQIQAAPTSSFSYSIWTMPSQSRVEYTRTSCNGIRSGGYRKETVQCQTSGQSQHSARP